MYMLRNTMLELVSKILPKNTLGRRGFQILASVFGIDTVKVVCTRPDVIHRALGRVRNGIVVLLPESKSINKLLTGHNLHLCQSVNKIHLPSNLGSIALDTKSEETRSTSTSKREQAHSLVLELRWLDGGDKRGKTSIQRRRVHVSKSLRASHGRLNFLRERWFGGCDERLFDVFI